MCARTRAVGALHSYTSRLRVSFVRILVDYSYLVVIKSGFVFRNGCLLCVSDPF
jgi:hypothetical protein